MRNNTEMMRNAGKKMPKKGEKDCTMAGETAGQKKSGTGSVGL